MHKILLPRIIQSGILGDDKTCKFQLTAKFMARKELLFMNLDTDPTQLTSKISYNGRKQVNKPGEQGYDP